MEDNQVSRTALINAYVRGYHATNDTPKIFDDFLAHQLLTEEEHKSFDQLLYTSSVHLMQKVLQHFLIKLQP